MNYHSLYELLLVKTLYLIATRVLTVSLIAFLTNDFNKSGTRGVSEVGVTDYVAQFS